MSTGDQRVDLPSAALTACYPISDVCSTYTYGLLSCVRIMQHAEQTRTLLATLVAVPRSMADAQHVEHL